MTRRTLLVTGGALLAAACLLGIMVVVIPAGGTNGADVEWNQLMAQLRQPWMLSTAFVLNRIGGGVLAIIVVPVLIIAALVLLRRWRAAVYAAAALLLSVGLTQLLKEIFGRARPEGMLVASDYGSFPSGHTANAATIAVLLWLVIPRVWMALIGALWVMAMALSRTILEVHWVSDTIGGALIGASAALIAGGMMLGWASLGWTRRSTVVVEE